MRDFRRGFQEAAQARYDGNPRLMVEHRFAGVSLLRLVKHLFVGSDIRKTHPYRISYLRATGRKGFWAIRRRRPEVASNSYLPRTPFEPSRWRGGRFACYAPHVMQQGNAYNCDFRFPLIFLSMQNQ